MDRSDVEKLVDSKIIESLKRFRISGGSYWQKISQFQVLKDGKLWRVVDAFDVGRNYQKCQLCGHFPCRHMYVIQSDTGEKLTIGSECVLNYVKDVNAREILRRYQQNYTTKVMVVQTARQTLLDIANWVSKNGGNWMTSAYIRQLLAGKPLSKSQKLVLAQKLQTVVSPELKEVRIQTAALINAARRKVRNDWENRFMISIVDQFSRSFALSEKQLTIIRRIAAY